MSLLIITVHAARFAINNIMKERCLSQPFPSSPLAHPHPPTRVSSCPFNPTHNVISLPIFLCVTHSKCFNNDGGRSGGYYCHGNDNDIVRTYRNASSPPTVCRGRRRSPCPLGSTRARALRSSSAIRNVLTAPKAPVGTPHAHGIVCAIVTGPG